MIEKWHWDSRRRYNAGLSLHPRLGWDLARRQLEPETITYLALPGANLDARTVNNYIKAVKYGSGVTFASQTCNISNPETSPLFITNPLTDIRWATGFYLTLTETTNTLKVLVGAAGTGETYGADILPNNTAVSDSSTEGNATTGWASTLDTFESSAISPSVGTYNFHCVSSTTQNYSVTKNATASALYKTNINYKKVSGVNYYEIWSTDVGLQYFSLIITALTYTSITRYLTQSRSTGFYSKVQVGNAAAAELYTDNQYIEQVLAPSATGVWFSAPVVTGAFNYNAASYTVTISKT
jgi:hypothetical protein